jgi:hypothetical protein
VQNVGAGLLIMLYARVEGVAASLVCGNVKWDSKHSDQLDKSHCNVFERAGLCINMTVALVHVLL